MCERWSLSLRRKLPSRVGCGWDAEFKPLLTDSSPLSSQDGTGGTQLRSGRWWVFAEVD